MEDNKCEHKDIEAAVDITALAEDEEAKARGEINRYVMDIHVRCADCKTPFGFYVPDFGLLPDRPTVSPDFLELRVPLKSPSMLELTAAQAVLDLPDA